jgi:hypothetical protein
MEERPRTLPTFDGISLDAERLELVRSAFAEIHKEIEFLRTLDLQETHPAVVFRPVERRQE